MHLNSDVVEVKNNPQANNFNEQFSFTYLHSWLLFLLILLPLSCTAQENLLNRVSSTPRSDGQGHVIRFHLSEPTSSIDFSQPHPYLVQLELRGSGLQTSNIQLQDDSDIIDRVKYYKLNGGIGAEIFLNDGAFYQAAAYPDRGGSDVLVGLTETDTKSLATITNNAESFAWSDTPITSYPYKPADSSESSTTRAASIDTSYQNIKDKIKFDTVVLDAGHGGQDVGTHHNGVYEKNVVLDIARKVGNYIKQSEDMKGVEVVFTRDGDYLVGARNNSDISIMESLVRRGKIANRAEGDLFVSIHANAVPSAPSAHGTETYFLGLERSQSALDVMKRENRLVGPGASIEDELSQEELAIYELANSGYIANSEKIATMVENQFKNRAQRHSRGVKQARFVVLYHASMPAILIETGFLSNRSEAGYLNSDYGQNIIASAIFRAIRDYKEQFEKSQHIGSN